MKGLKKKLRRGLAGFLSFVLTMTSFNMVSWADVAAAFEKENATFVMSGEDLRDSAQAAIDNGDEFNFEDLGVDTSDRSLAKEYQRLFETGSVFEFAPAYDMDEEEYADGAELRMFIRINGDPEGYQITGDEDIIFLYINDSDARVTFRSRIDGYTTQKVTVKGNSTLLDAEAPVGGEGNGNGAGGAGANGGAGSEVQNPDGNAGGEDGAVDGTVQNPDGNANMGEAADGNGTTNGDVQNPDANAGGAIDSEGAASGDVQNPDANVSDGNGTNDGTVQNPAANADGENTDHSNTNTGKEEQVQKPEDHAGTNGGVQNSDTNKTEDGGKAEAGNSESGSSNSGAASDGGASNSGASDGGASNSGASNSGASDSGSSNSGASDSGSSDSGSDQGDSLVSAATLNRHYTHILTTAVNGDAGSKESDKVSSDEGKEDKVDAVDKTDKADNTDTSDKHDSEDVNSDTNTEDGSNGGNADKDAVVTPDGEEGNSAVEDNKADAVTPDNGENQDPSDDKADDQGEVSKPDDGQGDAVIDDNSDKDNADKDNADKNAAEDNKADDTTVDGKDHAANGEDGKKDDSLVVDSEADEKEEVSKTGTTSGKTYGQVVLDESYYAKAYVTTLNKLHIDVSKEGYAVTYTVTPVGTAAVKGAKNVEEGKDLTFTVKPQVGYVIDHVTANGESLEAVEDDEATASNADTGVKRFVVPEIEEEQEIVVVMAEIGEHPEFHGKVVINGVTISADAEEGILPEGTKLSVEEVTEQVEQVVKEKVEASEDTTVTSVLAYDINLMLDGKKLDNSWSENGYVNVKISGERITESSKEADKVEVVHLQTPTEEVEAAEGGVAEVPVLSELSTENIEINHVEIGSNRDDSIDVSGDSKINELSFEADHFSLYVVVNSKTYYNSYEMRLGDESLIIKTDNAGSKYSGWSWSIENDKGVVSLSNEERGSVKVTAKVDGEAVILYYKNYMANPQKFKVTVLPGGAMVKISGPETSESATAQLSASVIDPENPNISQEVRWELVSGLAEVDDTGLVTKKGSQSGGASGAVVVKATSMESPELSATYTIQFTLNNYFTFTNDSETTGVRVYYSLNGDALKVIETGETIVVSIKANTINGKGKEGIQFYAASEEGYETTTEFSAAGGYQEGKSSPLADVPKSYCDHNFTSAIAAANNKGCTRGFYYGDWTSAGTANRAFKLSADPIKVSVEYKPGATSVSNMPTDSSRYTIKDTVTLKNQIPVRNGYTFSGWKLEGTDKIYNSSDKIPVKQVWKNITYKTLVFVAQWTENKDITINYVIRGNGSLTNVKETISSANRYDNPSGSTAIPYEGYKFVKWTSEDNELARAVSTSAKFVPDKPSSVGEYTYYAWITEDYSIKKTISVNYYRNNSFAGSEEKEVWIHADTVSLDEIKVPKVVDVSGYSYDHVVPGADGNGEIRIPSVGENDIRVYYSKKYDLEITSASQEKVYDGTVLTDNRYETSGLRQGHVISGVQVEGEITSVGEVNNSITGTPVIRDQKGNDVTAFYNIKYTTGKLRITEATINVTASAGEKFYGEADPEVFVYSFTNGVNGESVSFDGALVRTPGEDVGSYLINLGSLTLKSNGNFNANNYKIEFVQGSFTINPAVLTVSAEHMTKIYGADDPKFSYNVSGEKNGEKALFTGTLNREKGENVGIYKIVQGSLVLDSHDNFKADNYKLNYKENILEITAAPANFELSVTGGEILYDGKTHAAIVSSTNDPELVITYEHSTDNKATWQPGPIEVKDVDDGTVWIRATAVKPNYLPVEDQDFIRIIPEKILVTAASTTKPYGSSDPVFTFDYSGAVNGETAKFDGVLSRKEGEELGKYNIIQGSLELVDNGTFKKSNYTLDFTEGILEIIKADIDLKLSIQGGQKVYDGQPHTAVAKAIEGATLHYEYSKDGINWTNGNLSVKDVEDGILHVKAIAEMSNYNSQEVETTIQVIPKKLTVTALEGNKEYGAEDPKTYGFKYEGEVTGELPAFEGALTRTAGEDCDQYDILQSDLALKDNGAFKASNYELMYESRKFTINPATLTVTAVDKSRQYKEKNPEFTYTIEGLRRGDLSSSLELAVIMETIATEDSVNGTYPILIKGNETVGNYKVTYVPGTLTVTDSDALTISGEGKGWIYDGVEQGLLTGPATTNVDGAEIRYTVNGTTGKEVPKALNAGTYEIEITASKANYKTVTKTISVVVAKAPLIVSADQKEREYKKSNPSLSYTINGLKGADTKESIKDELGISLETSANEISPVGNYPIKIKGEKPEQISNYTVSYEDGILKVTDNTGMTLAATGYNSEYDGSLHNLITSVTPSEEDAKITYEIGGETYETIPQGRNAGTYTILVTASKANYEPKTVTVSAAISKAELNLTATSFSRQYGQENGTLEYSLSGFKPGDSEENVKVEANLVTEAGKTSPTGTYTITFADYTSETENYKVIPVNGLLTVVDNETLGIRATPFTGEYTGKNQSLLTEVEVSQPDAKLTYTVNETAGSTVPEGKNVGKYSITITAEKANYKTATLTVTSEITPAALTVTADNKTRAYREANPEFTYRSTGYVEGESSADVDLAVAMETPATEESETGDYQILITGNETAGNYRVMYVPGTLTVTASEAMTVSGEGKGWTYDGVERGLLTGPATTNVEGAEIRYTVNGTEGTEVPKALNAGTYVVTITAEKENYVKATAEVTVVVEKAELTVSADPQERQYGKENPELTYSVSGLKETDTKESVSKEFEISLETKAEKTSPSGTYDIVINGEKPEEISNYKVVYQDGILKVTDNTGMTLAATGYNGTYDGTLHNLITSVTPSEDDAKITYEIGGETYETIPQGRNAGTYTILVTASKTNYEPKTVTVSAAISKAELNLTATSFSRQYGQENGTLEYSLSGFKPGDSEENVKVEANLVTEAGKTSPTGTYTITFADYTSETENYKVIPVNGLLTVVDNETLGIRATPFTGEYTGKNQSLLTEVEVSQPDAKLTYTVNETAGSTVPEGKNVGKYSITITAEKANYKTATLTVTSEITPAALTVTADNKTRAYREANPEFTYRSTGYVEGESSADVDLAVAMETPATEESETGDYQILITGNETAGNYRVMYVPGTLTVTASEAMTVSGEGKGWTYDGVERGLLTGPATTNVEGAEIRYTVNGTEGTEVPKALNAGTYVVTITAEKENYVKATAEVTVVVEKAELTVSAENKTREYGQQNPELTYRVNGLKTGDTKESLAATMAVKLSTIANELSEADQIYDIEINGNKDLANYTVNYIFGKLTVTKSNELTLAIMTYEGVYDGTSHGLIINAIPSIEQAEIEYSIDGINYDTKMPEKVNAGTYHVWISASLKNYKTMILEGDAIIRKKAVSVSAVNEAVVYGDKIPELTYVVDGIQENDLPENIGLNVKLSTVNSTRPNVGEYEITIGGNAESDNYMVSEYQSGTLSVTPKKAMIQAINTGKIYNEQEPELKANVTGTVGGEKLEYSLRREPGELVGVYPIYVNVGVNPNYEVQVEEAVFEITPADANAVFVTGENSVYDGNDHGVSASAVQSGSTILYSTNRTDWNTTSPTFTEAGTYTVYVKATNPNYNETPVVEGTVVISKREIAITAASAEKRYDGNDLTAPTAEITSGTLAEGQTLESVTVAGSQKTTGISANVASNAVIKAGDADVTANYAITYVDGTLTVTSSGNHNGGNDGGGSTPDNNKPYVPNGPGTDDGPTVTIDPDAVPLANAPVDGNPTDNLILIDDGNVPLAGLPKTGDRAGAQAGLAAILSGFLLAAFTMLNNKKKEENK